MITKFEDTYDDGITEHDYRDDCYFGKFNNQVAAFVRFNQQYYEHCPEVSTGEGCGVQLLGKRILFWDNDGFVNLDKYVTHAIAKAVFDKIEAHWLKLEGME